MPAPRESFETGIILGNLEQVILKFLQQNSKLVYTEIELTNELMRLSGIKNTYDFSWTRQAIVNNVKTFFKTLGSSTVVEKALNQLLKANKIICKSLETPFGGKDLFYGIK